jgi:hypothetical protein
LQSLTGSELEAIIQKLPKLKSPGPDKITYELLKMIPRRVLDRLAEDFRMELQNGTLPKQLFDTEIKPLSKKPGSAEIRPISLANSLLKLLDRAALRRLTRFLKEKNTIAPEQYGSSRVTRPKTKREDSS